MISILITILSLLLIIIAFLYFFSQLRKLIKEYKLIDSAIENDNPLEQLSNSPIADIVTAYAKTICQYIDGKNMSNIPSSEYFNIESISSKYKLNLKMIDTSPGTLVGLGLLGTFLGLTVGIVQFDSSNSDNIQESIQGLLGGMGTAFSTSLFGMLFSIIFTFFDKRWRNRLSKELFSLTEKLDSYYYIDDIQLIKYDQRIMMNSFIANIQKELNDKLTYTNIEGSQSTVGNAIREILAENEEQSKALKSFSTDLAMELNNGFDEVLSRQMQQKILPLMENVDATTKAIVEHIDQMAATVASPATDMMESVVSELKNSMSQVIDEFKTGLSGSATAELERLAASLGTATQAMGNFPKDMENISTTLQVTIEEVKNAITEISNTSANSNSAAMKQMQEQITFATTSISNAITEVKDVMANITQSSQQSSQDIINKLASASEKMGEFLNSTISQISSSVVQSMKNVTDDVTSKQTDLLALQEDTTERTKKLLETFNQGLDRLEKMNEYITGTMNMFQQAQGQITGSTAHLQTITSDMKVATEVFHKSQNDYAGKMESLQRLSQNNIDSISELLRNSGELSQEYVDKFDIIRQGLSGIFVQLQKGLSEYSTTVQATTQKYLDQYSRSLTETTDALSGTIQQQNEVVETLVDALNRNKR